MNYTKTYNNIIRKAITREFVEGYSEKHHIAPKCMGGPDNKHNIVTLTAREHFICHLLLHKMFPSHLGLLTAAKMMSNCPNASTYKVNARIYDTLRKHHSLAMSTRLKQYYKKTPHHKKGKKESDETRKRKSLSLKGKKPAVNTINAAAEWHKKNPAWNKGIPMSIEQRIKLSEAKKGIKLSREAKEKISKSSIDRGLIYRKWVHLDGTEEYLPIKKLIEKYNMPLNRQGSFSNVATGKQKSAYGWRLI